MKESRLLWLFFVYFFLTVLGGDLKENEVVVSNIFDWTLCNNGLSNASRIFHDTNCGGQQCDTRSIPTPLCQQQSILITSLESKHHIDKFFQMADEQYSIRRLHVKYAAHLYNDLAPYIDLLLMTRPWFFVRYETFPWTTSGSNHLLLVLDRYTHSLEYHLLYHASVQYPPEDICKRTALLVSRNTCTHPGWAGVLGMYAVQQQSYHSAVTAIYVSTSNEDYEVTAFAGGLGSRQPHAVDTNMEANSPMVGDIGGCHDRNRWLCAFYPSTNCTLPKELTDCRGDECVKQIPETHYFAAVYADGKFITPNQPPQDLQRLMDSLKEPLTANQKLYKDIAESRVPIPFVSEKQRSGVATLKIENNAHFKYLWPMAKASNYLRLQELARQSGKDTVAYAPIDVYAGDVLLQHGLWIRPNYRYRNHMAQTLRRFHEQSSVKFTDHRFASDGKETKTFGASKDKPATTSKRETLERCVAVQIRRGDRILDQATADHYAKVCKDEPEGDLGCRSIPFAFISLLNVTFAAEHLVDSDQVRHLVVATDDDDWLAEQATLLRAVAPKWHVHSLTAPWMYLHSSNRKSTIHSGVFPERTASPVGRNSNGGEWHLHSHFNAHDAATFFDAYFNLTHYTSFPYTQRHAHTEAVQKKSQTTPPPHHISESQALYKQFGRQSLAGGVHFFASLQLLQQCEAFVGHFDSGVAWMIYSSMCRMHRGGDIQGVCPPMFDLRKLKEAATTS